MQRCGRETVGPNLGGHNQVFGPDTQENSIEVVCKRIQNEEARLDSTSSLPASQMFSAISPLEAVKVLVSIMMSVILSNKGEPLKLRHYVISRAHFQGTAQRLKNVRFLAEDQHTMVNTKLADWSRACMELMMLPTSGTLIYVNLVCGELGGFRRGKHSAALFHSPNQDVRTAVHGDDFVCLSDDDGLKTHRLSS